MIYERRDLDNDNTDECHARGLTWKAIGRLHIRPHLFVIQRRPLIDSLKGSRGGSMFRACYVWEEKADRG
jgi:hypothetical protein